MRSQPWCDNQKGLVRESTPINDRLSTQRLKPSFLEVIVAGDFVAEGGIGSSNNYNTVRSVLQRSVYSGGDIRALERKESKLKGISKRVKEVRRALKKYSLDDPLSVFALSIFGSVEGLDGVGEGVPMGSQRLEVNAALSDQRDGHGLRIIRWLVGGFSEGKKKEGTAHIITSSVSKIAQQEQVEDKR